MKRKDGKSAYYIIAVIMLVNLLMLSACVRNEKEDTTIIAISMIGATHTWPEGVLYHAKDEVAKVAEENGWEFIVTVGSTSNEQSNQVIELIEMGVDCIIMLPMDGAALKTAAKAVQKADIPLVIFDREIPDFAPDATVKGDNPGIGVMTAEIFNQRFPSGTKVLEILGDASTVPFQRTAGYDDTINSNFDKVQLGYTGWQREQARVIFENWVEESSQAEINQIGAIFTHDDEIALGVLDALDAYEMDENFEKNFDHLYMIASSAGVQKIYNRIAIEEDYELFSLTYSPSLIREAIRIGEHIIKGQPYEEMTIISTENVDISNVADYIDPNSPF